MKSQWSGLIRILRTILLVHLYFPSIFLGVSSVIASFCSEGMLQQVVKCIIGGTFHNSVFLDKIDRFYDSVRYFDVKKCRKWFSCWILGGGVLEWLVNCFTEASFLTCVNRQLRGSLFCNDYGQRNRCKKILSKPWNGSRMVEIGCQLHHWKRLQENPEENWQLFYNLKQLWISSCWSHIICCKKNSNSCKACYWARTSCNSLSTASLKAFS